MKNADERSMLFLLKKGDEFAFTYFYFAYGGFVHLQALFILNDDAAADDVLQEVFFQLWENRKLINVNVPLKDYLFSSVKEVCIAYAMRRESETNEFPDMEAEGDGFSALARKEFLANIHEAILQVYPPACREILWLHVVKQMSYTEIAIELNIGVGVVRNQICKARKSLREILGLI